MDFVMIHWHRIHYHRFVMVIILLVFCAIGLILDGLVLALNNC